MTAIHFTSLIVFCAFFVFTVISDPKDDWPPDPAACYLGWFGWKCQYKCRCTNNNCDNNGLCRGTDTCRQSWFGPACQYADLAFGRSSVAGLADGRDDTCAASTDIKSVTISLNEPYPFTWLRVHGTKPESLAGLQVTFDNGHCNNPRTALVTDRTLDIFCTTDQFVQFVTLTGPYVSFLCSVYISGGRNVALRETTQQSSTYVETSQRTKNKTVSFTASLSVDGDCNSNFYSGLTCSCTKAEGQSPDHWSLSFSQVRRVNRYVIYGRTDGNPYRLQSFTLRSFAGTILVNDYKNQQEQSSVYTVKHGDLNVSVVQMVSGSWDKVLQMCEIEIYGDAVCSDGRYGRDCEQTCHCDGDKSCFPSTGGCPSGCAAGFQGENCSIPCRPGKHGPGCLRDCHQLCSKDANNISSCDSVSGACYLGCEDGHRGLYCNLTCEQDKYGSGCNQTCSQHCANGTTDETSCDNVDGTCRQGCETGYQKPLCSSPCESGKYGGGCSSICSSLCENKNTSNESRCHHVTGVCMFGCQGGYDETICQLDAGSPAGPESDHLIAILVGCVAAVVMGVVILAIVALILRRRRRGKRDTNSHSREAGAGGSRSLTEDDGGDAIQKTTGQTSKAAGAECQVADKTNSRAIYHNSLSSAPKSTAVSVADLAGFIQSNDKDFFKHQFSAIPDNKTATMTVGLSSENRHRNRYKNICAYDHSRVHLKANTAKKQGDYINASYIEGYKPDETFIASQGPTKVILEDFVRMLWEQRVDKVVMLTNLVEEGKVKCEKYWPDDGEMKIGEVIVSLSTTQVYADYTIHRLQLKKAGSPNQDLIHFHFTSWPDKDIPSTPWGLVDFEQRVASYPTHRPIVVHCSAGVGRTGTFIALRHVIREAQESEQVDFFTAVHRLRQNRLNMIQTAEQYIFLHKAALVAILCHGTTISSEDIEARIATLSAWLQPGQSMMEAEFQAVCSACDEKEEVRTSEDSPYSVYENSQTVANKQKNRVQFVLPKEMYRAKLRCENNEMTDYINAVLVPSFRRQNHQILTQLPLASTVTDFWRLVTQYKVKVIAVFQADLKSADPTIAEYMPGEDGESLSVSMFNISTQSVQSDMFWRQQQLCVTIDTEIMHNFSVVTTEHQLTHLTCSTTDLNSRTLLAITQKIRSLQPPGSGRVLYMCRNGAEYSGLVCVLSLLLDRMDTDHLLTVPLVVGAIKAVRPQVIPTLDQYRLLYESLQLYSESVHEYSNFAACSSRQ